MWIFVLVDVSLFSWTDRRFPRSESLKIQRSNQIAANVSVKGRMQSNGQAAQVAPGVRNEWHSCCIYTYQSVAPGLGVFGLRLECSKAIRKILTLLYERRLSNRDFGLGLGIGLCLLLKRPYFFCVPSKAPPT